MLELAALAFEAGSSKIRKRAQLYLRHGRLIQAVRLLLHTDDITRSALEQEPTTETFDEASYAGAVTTEDMDAAVQCPIAVPSLEAAAAAVGMKPCVSMTLAMKRELNMRILHMARQLINEDGDPSVQLGGKLMAAHATRKRKAKAGEEKEYYLSTSSQQQSMRHSRFARNLKPCPMLTYVTCFCCNRFAFTLALTITLILTQTLTLSLSLALTISFTLTPLAPT